MNFKYFVVFVLFTLNIWGCTSSTLHTTPGRENQTTALKQPYVVLVSLDAFRADYVDLYSPPFLTEFRKEGTAAESLIPVFPSKTFTNHLSIVTGLYAENHGIVANTFYDPARKETYTLSNRKAVMDPSWYGGEPIWVTAEKQGMISATYFWPGSEAPIAGERPTYSYEFNPATPPEKQSEQVVKWLQLPEEKRPHLITVYMHQVDSAGHEYGPRSAEVKGAVLTVDRVLGRLDERLKTLGLPINLVIVSDHGMEATDPTKVINIDDFAKYGASKVIGEGPQVMIYTQEATEKDQIYSALKKKEEGNHYRVYRREELPAEYHLAKAPRAGDILIVAEAPYSLVRNRLFKHFSAGNHGYDPQNQSMRAIFYASGPQIRKKLVLKPFRNIHIYPFLAKILGLKITQPIDGDLNVLAPALQ